MSESKYPRVVALQVEKYMALFRQHLSPAHKLLMNDDSVTQGIQRLFAISQYMAERCVLSPDLLFDHVISGSFSHSLTAQQLTNELNHVIKFVDTEAMLMKALRLFRHKQMVRILWRDANNQADIEQTMSELSQVAECCIDAALQWLYDHMTLQFGVPSANGVAQKMVVLGLGKLGGKELNFSSDVDLMFCYPRAGNTSGGQREVENQWFFNRLGQSLIRVLEHITEEGFAYRMDLRLRPYGSSGVLVWSFGAMEQYYQDQGRDWERYALLKASPVAGDKAQGYVLLQLLKPFIYRRYIDFSAIEALRNMKVLIHHEVLQKGMQKDIKRGPGGIREIEFIVQSFQLIYGGRNRRLQSVSLLETLKNLVAFKFLSQEETTQLRQAYLFLRRLEHLLQAWRDQQTHKLPVDSTQQIILAWGMGYASWESLEGAIEKVRSYVEDLFSSLLMEAPDAKSESEGKWQLLWERKSGDNDGIALLKRHNFQQAEAVYQQLKLLRDGRALKSASHQVVARVNRFIPALLCACELQKSPDQALLHILPIVNKVLRRTSYLVLLLERPDALFHLVKLCHDSSWVASEIARYPTLMDEFLNPGDLYNPPPPEQLQEELSRQLSHISLDNIEERLESLCYFKVAHLLKSVVAQTNGYMPLMAVSNYQTWIAETVVREVTQIAWRLMTQKYGFPEKYNVSTAATPFIVLGYGKLGGLEMGPGSDLDLVFIHDTEVQGATDGVHSLDHQAFFARFGQKVIHLLSMQTPFGKLYEVDVRLRPSGNAGLLVSSFNAFAKYHQESAWVWECQALIKARVIAGDNDPLAAAFTLLRTDMLQKSRDETVLQNEVKAMREKMLILDQSSNTQFDLKYGRGGIVDLEFLVQYMVLRFAHQHTALLRWTDNIRLLDTLGSEKLMVIDRVDALQQAYLTLRDVSHQRARQNQHNYVDQTSFVYERRCIIQAWNDLLSDTVSDNGIF